MAEIDDGGPAFPAQMKDTQRNGTVLTTCYRGMSVRAWLARQALKAGRAAVDAVDQADAVIAALNEELK